MLILDGDVSFLFAAITAKQENKRPRSANFAQFNVIFGLPAATFSRNLIKLAKQKKQKKCGKPNRMQARAIY